MAENFWTLTSAKIVTLKQQSCLLLVESAQTTTKTHLLKKLWGPSTALVIRNIEQVYSHFFVWMHKSFTNVQFGGSVSDTTVACTARGSSSKPKRSFMTTTECNMDRFHQRLWNVCHCVVQVSDNTALH